MGWISRDVEYTANVIAVARAYAAGEEIAVFDVVVGESAANTPTHTLICASPVAVLEQKWQSAAELRVGERVVRVADNAWELLQQIEPVGIGGADIPTAIAPGWMGFIGYEMNGFLERLPPSRAQLVSMPATRLSLFECGIVLDHVQRRATALALRGFSELLKFELPNGRLESASERWNAAVTACNNAAKNSEFRAGRLPACEVRATHVVSKREYEQRVERVREYIAAGDIYQANIAHPIMLQGLPDAFETAIRIRTANPAGYSALLRWGDRAVISASPELFLHRSGGAVTTRPIKGTARRNGDEIVDAAARQTLIDSEKDRAELAMIVDLHRNDLGRVCDLGSVRVERARYLESHPSVFHTVAKITGRLRSDRGTVDLLRACFPPGSITGVPKIRAMEIIAELENYARGVYCGTVCTLGLDGALWANVAIRTLQISGNDGVMYVGGGVVAESEPADEYAETLAKAGGILSAFGFATSLASQASRPLHYQLCSEME